MCGFTGAIGACLQIGVLLPVCLIFKYAQNQPTEKADLNCIQRRLELFFVRARIHDSGPDTVYSQHRCGNITLRSTRHCAIKQHYAGDLHTGHLMINHHLPTLILLAVGTFSSLPTLASQPIACGKEWINLHQKNPDLVGIYVQQLPDNKADETAYRGKHPSMIIYVFKNGKAHQISYTPSGQIESGFWRNIPPSDWIYNHLDRNFKEEITCAFWVKK